ncbi:MAG: methylthioribulose 1-phosphate dehydratase [Mariniblastus sp.]|nr:methylthioribulose 1-phosphate dehydratase [Mariniblastus sp.]
MTNTLTGTHPLSGQEVLIDQLRECGRLFHSRGWSVGTSSNYSVVLSNDPVELAVTASGKDKGRLEQTDFVHIGADGSPIETNQPKSSAETMLHVVLAEQPEVGCILHTHSVWGTLLSDHFFEQGGFDIEGFEMLKGLEGIKTHEHSHWIPVFENTQDIPMLADKVRERLDDPMEPMTHGFLIRKHGLYTWGKDVFSARRHIEIYEFLFECVARKIGMPGI